MRTDRRDFLKYGLITSSVFFGSVYGFREFRKLKKKGNYSGQLIDPSGRGHQLRKAFQQQPTRKERIPVLIAGAGMSGLVTGHYLKQSGFEPFKIMEMSSMVGGNSAYGQNEVSKYPWAAHYIPLPNKENTALIHFLESMGLARTGKDLNSLEFAEEHLCHDPQERMFIKGDWQESILPGKNISADDQVQLERFHKLVHEYKYKKGRDGKFVFSIPVVESSQDPDFLKLDKVSFDDFLAEQGFSSDVVYWYMNYCTLDDYGMGTASVSAWAGLHYFCARRPIGVYEDHKILTWPEGNGWLMQKLADELKDQIQTNSAVMSIQKLANHKVSCRVFNFESQELVEYEADRLVYAAPMFLAPYLFSQKPDTFNISADDYYSWLVANVTVKLTPGEMAALHWDNVRFQSQSLGYVHARHQELRSRVDENTVLTLYWPLYDKKLSATEVRKRISGLTWNDWAPLVEKELAAMHPGIATSITHMDIKIHGHAMIGPRLGRMHDVFTHARKQTSGDAILFAHTDHSGMSLFEEAHYWGHRVSREILKRG